MQTDQRVGIQKLREDVSHEHGHVRRARLQQLDVLERAVHLRERRKTHEYFYRWTESREETVGKMKMTVSPHWMCSCHLHPQGRWSGPSHPLNTDTHTHTEISRNGKHFTVIPSTSAVFILSLYMQSSEPKKRMMGKMTGGLWWYIVISVSLLVSCILTAMQVTVVPEWWTKKVTVELWTAPVTFSRLKASLHQSYMTRRNGGREGCSGVNCSVSRWLSVTPVTLFLLQSMGGSQSLKDSNFTWLAAAA